LYSKFEKRKPIYPAPYYGCISCDILTVDFRGWFGLAGWCNAPPCKPKPTPEINGQNIAGYLGYYSIILTNLTSMI
jgi:hypothetical protein